MITLFAPHYADADDTIADTYAASDADAAYASHTPD